MTISGDWGCRAQCRLDLNAGRSVSLGFGCRLVFLFRISLFHPTAVTVDKMKFDDNQWGLGMLGSTQTRLKCGTVGHADACRLMQTRPKRRTVGHADACGLELSAGRSVLPVGINYWYLVGYYSRSVFRPPVYFWTILLPKRALRSRATDLLLMPNPNPNPLMCLG